MKDKIELVLRDGSTIPVPAIDHFGSNGWAWCSAVDIPAGATVVAARVTYDLPPESFDCDGTFTLQVKGLDVR